MRFNTSRSASRTNGGVHTNVVYGTAGVMAALGVNQESLNRLIQEGMPSTRICGRRYFPGRLIVE